MVETSALLAALRKTSEVRTASDLVNAVEGLDAEKLVECPCRP